MIAHSTLINCHNLKHHNNSLYRASNAKNIVTLTANELKWTKSTMIVFMK